MQAHKAFDSPRRSKREGRGPIFTQAQSQLASGSVGLAAKAQFILTLRKETYKDLRLLLPRLFLPVDFFAVP
jgi:hypothetical protein